MVYVRPYRKRDGTRVAGYTRKASSESEAERSKAAEKGWSHRKGSRRRVKV